jgi:hypothetical protein
VLKGARNKSLLNGKIDSLKQELLMVRQIALPEDRGGHHRIVALLYIFLSILSSLYMQSFGSYC